MMKKIIALFLSFVVFTSSFNVFANQLSENKIFEEITYESDSNLSEEEQEKEEQEKEEQEEEEQEREEQEEEEQEEGEPEEEEEQDESLDIDEVIDGPFLTADFLMNQEPFAFNDEDNSYTINSKEGFDIFREEVENRDDGFYGYNIILNTFIDMKGEPMKPIGSISKPFQGSFDGGGNTISNISLEEGGESETYYGFFGYVFGTEDSVTIKDLNLEFSGDVGDSNADYAGLLCANIWDAWIDNCSVSGNIKLIAKDNAGGLIANVSNVKITDCEVNIDSIDTGNQAGGLVSTANVSLTITNSQYIGDISVNSSDAVSNVGGIIGFIDDANLVLANTKFEGNIEISSDKDISYVGGIVGNCKSSRIDIDDVSSTGDITVKGNNTIGVGGIVGYLDGYYPIIHARTEPLYYISINKAEVKGSINITGLESASAVGGLIGWAKSNTGRLWEITITNSGLNGSEIRVEGNSVEKIGGIAGTIEELIYDIDNVAFSMEQIKVTGVEVSYISGGVGYNIGREEVEENSLVANVEINTDIVIDAKEKIRFIAGLAVTDECPLKIKASSFEGVIKILGGAGVENLGGISVAVSKDFIKLKSEMLIDDVKFLGDITAQGKSLNCAGGIIDSSDSFLIMNNSKFIGDISLDFTDSILNIGGVAGEIKQAAIFLKDIEFNGNIRLKTYLSESIGGIAGMAKLNTYRSPKAAMFKDYAELMQVDSLFENIDFYGEISVELPEGGMGSVFNLSGIATFFDEMVPNDKQSKRRSGSVLLKNITRSGDIVITGKHSKDSVSISGIGGVFNLSNLFLPVNYSIENIASKSNIVFDINGDNVTLEAVGSFIGILSGNNSISNSYASGSIDYSGKGSLTAKSISGFAGTLDTQSEGINIENCYSTTDIILRNDGSKAYSSIAGFLGSDYTVDFIEINNCYYAGMLHIDEGLDDVNIAVFASCKTSPDINKEDIKNNYYDKSKNEMYPAVSESLSGAGVAPRTTLDMVRENADENQPHFSDVEPLNDFDFIDTWVWSVNDKDKGNYPQLDVFVSSKDERIRTLSRESTETDAYYHINFDGNGGSDADGISLYTGWELYSNAVSGPAFKKDNVHVKRWNTKENGAGKDYPLNFNVESDLVLYAMYEDDVIPKRIYTVTYDINGGTGTTPEDSNRYNSGDKVTVLGSSGFSRAGYTFEGWRLNSGERLYQKGNVFNITRNSDLTAQWKKISDEKEDKDKSISEPSYKVPETPVELPELNREEHFAYIVGYPDNTVRPENNITREEIASIYFRLLTDDSREKYYSAANPFKDVDEGRWSNKAVSTLYNAGILTGEADSSFRPSDSITRAEAAVIAARFDAGKYTGEMYFTDIEGHWAHEYINKAAYLGWIEGYADGTFKPDSYITRAETAAFINQVLERNVLDSSHMSKNMITWIDNMDERQWYYRHIQEAGNGHTYHKDGEYETWIDILEPKQWIEIERP